jgi:hypothetical protein
MPRPVNQKLDATTILTASKKNEITDSQRIATNYSGTLSISAISNDVEKSLKFKLSHIHLNNLIITLTNFKT